MVRTSRFEKVVGRHGRMSLVHDRRDRSELLDGSRRAISSNGDRYDVQPGELLRHGIAIVGVLDEKKHRGSVGHWFPRVSVSRRVAARKLVDACPRAATNRSRV